MYIIGHAMLIAQMCTSVFGLIGFSGLPGREAEQLSFISNLPIIMMKAGGTKHNSHLHSWRLDS